MTDVENIVKLLEQSRDEDCAILLCVVHQLDEATVSVKVENSVAEDFEEDPLITKISILETVAKSLILNVQRQDCPCQSCMSRTISIMARIRSVQQHLHNCSNALSPVYIKSDADTYGTKYDA